MYRCKECNSKEVEGRYWVNHNTSKIASVVEDAEEIHFCCECEELVNIYDDELETNENT